MYLMHIKEYAIVNLSNSAHVGKLLKQGTLGQ